jgi:hypothetical protein
MHQEEKFQAKILQNRKGRMLKKISSNLDQVIPKLFQKLHIKLWKGILFFPMFKSSYLYQLIVML